MGTNNNDNNDKNDNKNNIYVRFCFMIPKLEISITATQMGKIGYVAVSLANEDALNGIMQDEKSGLQYRSKQYAKYKANAMRRFTRDVQARYKETQFGSGLFTGRNAGRKSAKQVGSNIHLKSKLTSGSNKLKGYNTRSINTDVSKVNLHLTGDMFRSLKVISKSNNICRVSFSPEQAGKVLGNIKNGYQSVGLNKKNQDVIKELIIQQLNANKNKIKGNYKI